MRATGARGRTNRAGPRSSTRGVYTHDAAAARRDAKCTFLPLPFFFIFFSAGTILPLRVGTILPLRAFRFIPRARTSRALESGSDTQRTTLTVGWVPFYHYVWVLFYHCALFIFFSTCAISFLDVRVPCERTITSSDSREKKTPSDFAFSARIALLSNAIAGARGTRGARRERTAARASPSGRTQTRADGSRACLARFRSAPGDAREGRTQTRVKKKRSSRVTTAAIARRTRWTRTRTPGWRRRRARTSRRPSQRRASRPVRPPARSRD